MSLQFGKWIILDSLTGTLFSDVCSNEDLPEVELVNLLEEQLPQYKLRVDSLFLYENQDWAQSSHQPQDAPETLSPVLAEETFRYMSEFLLLFLCLVFTCFNSAWPVREKIAAIVSERTVVMLVTD